MFTAESLGLNQEPSHHWMTSLSCEPVTPSYNKMCVKCFVQLLIFHHKQVSKCHCKMGRYTVGISIMVPDLQ